MKNPFKTTIKIVAFDTHLGKRYGIEYKSLFSTKYRWLSSVVVQYSIKDGSFFHENCLDYNYDFVADFLKSLDGPVKFATPAKISELEVQLDEMKGGPYEIVITDFRR